MKNSLLILIVSLPFQACGQQPKSKNKSQVEVSSVDFWRYNGDGRLTSDTSGLIHFRSYYYGKKNEIGFATVYLIHKNGGRWWYEQAKKMFPNNDAPINRRGYYAVVDMCDNLLSKDSVTLKDYYKWSFFVDKKYLIKAGEESAQGDAGVVTYDYYGVKPDAVISILLYEQKAGSDQWVLIDKFRYTTDNKGSEPGTKDNKGDWRYPSTEWRFDFIRRKLQESNSKK